MKESLFSLTRLGISKEIIENLRKNYDQNFKKGNLVYCWSDALVEFKITKPTKLSEIVDEFKKNSDEVNIGTSLDKTSVSISYFNAINHAFEIGVM